MSKTPNIQLHIEALILHGFSATDRYRIVEIVQNELTQLLASQGVPPALAQGGTIPSLDGGEFEFTQDMSIQSIGAQIAQSIYGGLSQ